MSDLPDRGIARWATEGVDMWDKSYGPVAKQIIEAYADGVLRSRDEMDDKATGKMVFDLWETLPPRPDNIDAPSADHYDWIGRMVLDAAWGVTDE